MSLDFNIKNRVEDLLENMGLPKNVTFAELKQLSILNQAPSIIKPIPERAIPQASTNDDASKLMVDFKKLTL